MFVPGWRKSRFDPDWAALRHVRDVTAAAACDGVADVLLVGDRSSRAMLGAAAAGVAGTRAEIAIGDLLSGDPGKAFAPMSRFGLCLCGLGVADLASLPQVFSAVKPFLKPDAVFVALHRNAGGQPPGAFILPDEGALRDGDEVTVHYAGLPQPAALLWQVWAMLSPAGLRQASIRAVARRLRSLWQASIGHKPAVPPPKRPDPCVGVTATVERTYRFAGDDGTLKYATDAGVYVPPNEAPLQPDRVVDAAVAMPPGSRVILAFGQSNAANAGEGIFAADGPVHVFNVFDRKFYRAIDPLPGATDFGGSEWGRLGERLIGSGLCPAVVVVPIAYGASFVAEWSPGGPHFRRLMFALRRLQASGIAVDALCWQQGEAEANHTLMKAEEYRDLFLLMLKGIRRAGVQAPVYVALATLCDRPDNPHRNHAEIRRGQQMLLAPGRGVLPGPDMDAIGPEYRRDGCHFSAAGLDRAAEAWYRALAADPGPLARVERRHKVAAVSSS